MNSNPTRRIRHFAMFLFVTGMVMLLAFVLIFMQPPAAAKGKGMNAPEFPQDAKWLNTQAPLTMADLQGRVVILDFWTYCCINCLHALPVLHQVEEHFADQPVTVIGVHSGKFDQEHNDRKVLEAIAKYGVAHPVVQDDDFTIWNEWSVRAWPTIVYVGTDGKIAKFTSGEPDFAYMKQTVDELLAAGKKNGTLGGSTAPVMKSVNADTGALNYPGKVLAAGDKLFIADSGHHRILIAERDGRVVETIGGKDDGFVDGNFATARFFEPQGLALNGGTLYVADRNNHAIRAIDLQARTVKTIAGTGRKGNDRSKGGKPLAVDLRSPWDVAWRDGGLDIAMAGSHQIWRLDLGEDEIGVLAGSGHEQIIDGYLNASAFAQPSGLHVDGEKLYIADSETSAVRRIDLETGKVETLVGTGLFDFGFKDGKGKRAKLQHPLGITGRDGKLYIADSFNNALRILDLNDEDSVTTLAVSGVGDLNEPSGLTLEGGILYVADTNNHRVLSVRLADRSASEVTLKF
ncbi:MAG: thioredoxin-like domain-containing protein [Candidatus Lernaella stagnicola]|nr:thioredoxin-like domain-containing protein [Candidatus Lernaella stagnicola]